METIDVNKQIEEIRSLLWYSNNMGFFFGAGTSCAFGLPDVNTLTDLVEGNLEGDFNEQFRYLKENLKPLYRKSIINVEDILNYLRLIRDITAELPERNYDGISGDKAKELDLLICKSIYKVINERENEADITDLRKFVSWLDLTNRDNVKEIYTTNYDLLFEKSMESTEIPYYDGFIGSFEPFFWSESIERFVMRTDLTFNWIRLWKIHGSLNWGFRDSRNVTKIVRTGKTNMPENELVIYPSKEKYNLSRKQPFLAYFDRLKNYLVQGELLLLISGYSFSDQHINEIIINGLRQNSRLFSIVFCYSDEQVTSMEEIGKYLMNLCVLGPKLVIANGTMHQWEYNDKVGDLKDSELYWDSTSGSFLLGDFRKLVGFLISNSGKKRKIEEKANGK